MITDVPEADVPIGEGEGSPGYMNPNDIRFGQPYVSPRFGGSVAGELSPEDLADALRAGEAAPEDVPPIRVFQDDAGNWWTLDNRRLMAFRMADMDAPVVPATPEDWAAFGAAGRTFEPVEDGLAIFIIDEQDPVASFLWWNPALAEV